MAGLINWKKFAIPSTNPDSDHLYVGIDVVDCFLYIKDDAGTVTKYVTSANVAAQISAALANYDLSTVVDSKISNAINNLVNGAGAALDTLNELAAALGNDPNFATTVTNSLALKANTADLGALAFLDTVDTAQIEDNAISANKIQNNAVTSAKININVVTNSKLTDMPAFTLKGNDTASTGDPKDLTVSEAKAFLGFQDSADVSSAIAAHVALPDPHPQYTTVAEAAAAAPVQSVNGETGVLTNYAKTNVDNNFSANQTVLKPNAVIEAQSSTATDAVYIARSTNSLWAFGSHDFTNEFRIASTNGLSSSLLLRITTALFDFTSKRLTNVADPVNAQDAGTKNYIDSQVSASSVNDRNRANHTGTQLASTISDFATTVRNTVLTGLSTATSAVITASDTVLSALGKLQAQLNSMVFGNEYQYFEDLTAFNTTSGAFVNAASFTTASLVGGFYRINMQWNYTNNSGTSSSRFRVYVDGVATSSLYEEELQDTSNDTTTQVFARLNLSAGTHTIDLRVNSENSITTTVSTVRCDIWRVS